MALLEPQAPDALAAWGRFNNAFEQKEYMEEYVAEEGRPRPTRRRSGPRRRVRSQASR
jgi:hypothetical protein